MSKAWYALRSKPHKEFSLHSQLQAHNLECYFPRIKVKPVNPRAAKIKPYFPSYLFIYCDIEEIGNNRFKWMPHAQGLVSFGGNPAVVPSNIISGMKKNIGNIYHQEKKHTDSIQPGTSVVITDGPFQGYEGIFDTRLDENQRVKVLLELINDKQVPISLDADQIQPRRRR